MFWVVLFAWTGLILALWLVALASSGIGEWNYVASNPDIPRLMATKAATVMYGDVPAAVSMFTGILGCMWLPVALALFIVAVVTWPRKQ